MYVIKNRSTFDPLFHRPILAIVHGRIGYYPLSAMSGRRPLAVAGSKLRFRLRLSLASCPQYAISDGRLVASRQFDKFVT